MDLDIPFAALRHPGLDSATEARQLDWLRRHGLLRGAAALDRFRRWRVSDGTARWFPTVPLPELDLAAGIFGWFLLLDDQFDGVRGESPELAAELVTEIQAALDGAGPGAGASSLATAFAELWRREQEGMSDAWRERSRRHWREFLGSYVTEARNRSESRVLDLAAYNALRDVTGLMPVLLDAMERIAGCELPGTVLSVASFERMRYLTTQIVDGVNDVASLAKEEARGDQHNLVLVLEAQLGDRDRATARVAEMMRGWTDEFLAREAGLPAELDRARVPPADRARAHDFVAVMRSAIRGNYDWSASTARYASHDFRPAHEPAYVEDLTTAFVPSGPGGTGEAS